MSNSILLTAAGVATLVVGALAASRVRQFPLRFALLVAVGCSAWALVAIGSGDNVRQRVNMLVLVAALLFGGGLGVWVLVRRSRHVSDR